MNHPGIFLALVISLLVSCAAKPTLTITSSLGSHTLRGKTLAVGGFEAQDLTTYPGQSDEAIILMDAGTAMQRRFKRSRVLSAEAAWAAAGAPPTKYSSPLPILIGRKLSVAFLRQTSARGIDYLLWIDLLENSVENSSSQWTSTRTETTSCHCSKKNGAKCSRSSCGSSCGGSCCQTTRAVTEYHAKASASRSLKSSYSLLDTASGRVVWRADAALTGSNSNGSTSESKYPAVPSTPLPPMEAKLMQRMTTAAIARVPK